MRFAVFAASSVATLIAIAISNAVGIGHTWPFYVIIPLLLTTAATAIIACTEDPPDDRLFKTMHHRNPTTSTNPTRHGNLPN